MIMLNYSQFYADFNENLIQAKASKASTKRECYKDALYRELILLL